eukprot:6273331-Amphidinium_carterae.1
MDPVGSHFEWTSGKSIHENSTLAGNSLLNGKASHACSSQYTQGMSGRLEIKRKLPQIHIEDPHTPPNDTIKQRDDHLDASSHSKVHLSHSRSPGLVARGVTLSSHFTSIGAKPIAYARTCWALRGSSWL